MIFEYEYLYNEHARWALGWASPNYAGSFIACIIPWLWYMRMIIETRADTVVGNRTKSLARLMLLLFTGLELVCCFLLSMTYSRGALVAVGCSIGWLILCSPTPNVVLKKNIYILIGMLTVCVVVSGFVTRLTTGYLKSDKSVVNRWELYTGGIQMMAVAPLRGWGDGESGVNYMNYYQDLNKNESYATMVNSYLHIGVEHGFPALGGALLIIIVLVMVVGTNHELSATNDSFERVFLSALRLPAGSSLVAWNIANMFTTLWIVPKLWIMPMIAAVTVLYSVWSDRKALRWRSIIGVSLATTVFFLLVTIAIGMVLLSRQSLVIKPLERGAVLLSTPSNAKPELGALWHAWLDQEVLGSSPGKEMRRLMENHLNKLDALHTSVPDERRSRSGIVSQVVVHSQSDSKALPPTSSVMLFGKQAERLTRVGKEKPARILLVHPSGNPPSQENTDLYFRGVAFTVLLPELDETGSDQRWRKWADSVGAYVNTSKGVGRDIRAAWPEVYFNL